MECSIAPGARRSRGDILLRFGSLTQFLRCQLLLLGLVGCTTKPQSVYGTPVLQHDPNVLRINNGSEPETLDPGLSSESTGSELISNLFAGLLDTDPHTGAPVAEIASSWQVDTTHRRYRFTLRASRWSDGVDLSAEDFIFAWRRILDPKTASRNASLLYVFNNAQAFHEGWLRFEPSADANQVCTMPQQLPKDAQLHPQEAQIWLALPADQPPQLWEHTCVQIQHQWGHLRPASPNDLGMRSCDAHTLEVTLSQPTPYFLHLLAHTALRPVPRHLFDTLMHKHIDPALWTRPEHMVSNGAYTLQRWRFKRDMRLAKNPYYWDHANVAIPLVDVLQIENAYTALNLYRTGEIDWLGANTSIPSEFVQSLQHFTDFSTAPMLSVYFYWLNTKDPQLSDPRVRKALSLAIDRQALVRYVLRGGQIPTADLVPQGLQGYPAAQNPLFDPNTARQLLQQAGYTRAHPLPMLTLRYNTADSHRQIAEAIQAMWQQHLGVQVELENQEWRVFLQNVERGQFQIARLGWIGDYPDANSFLYDILSCHAHNNASGWLNPQYEQLLTEANHLTDPQKRLTLLHQAEVLALNEQPLIPLFFSTYPTLVQPYVRGYSSNPLNKHPYKHFSFQKGPSI